MYYEPICQVKDLTVESTPSVCGKEGHKHLMHNKCGTKIPVTSLIMSRLPCTLSGDSLSPCPGRE